MFKKFYPYEYEESVFTIDYEKLYSMGFRAVIFDIDNTLVHHGDDSTPEIDELFKHIHKSGLKTLLLSNNSEERIQRFMRNIESLYIAEAQKPEPGNYLKAVEMLGVKKDEAVMVGDQIFTDILGANRCGMASILVKFILLKNETKIGIRRHVEKVLLRFYSMNKSCRNRLGNVHKREKGIKKDAVSR